MRISTHKKKVLHYFADTESEVEERATHDEGTEFLELSFDEEYAVATWVMDVLCLVWIDTKPEFQRFLSDVIWRKSRGKDLSMDQLAQIVDYCSRYDDLLPPFPTLTDNGAHITAPKKYVGMKSIEWIQKTVRQAWYEIWDQHPYMRKRAGMHIFPNAEPDAVYIARQEKLEEDFWAEVNRKQKDYECDRSEAVALVSDYMERGTEIVPT